MILASWSYKYFLTDQTLIKKLIYSKSFFNDRDWKILVTLSKMNNYIHITCLVPLCLGQGFTRHATLGIHWPILYKKEDDDDSSLSRHNYTWQDEIFCFVWCFYYHHITSIYHSITGLHGRVNLEPLKPVDCTVGRHV